MQTLMVEVTSDRAMKVLRSLSEKKQIRIVEEAQSNSPALPGQPLPLSAFKNWIEAAEQANTTSLTEAKKIWAGKRKHLQKLTR